MKQHTHYNNANGTGISGKHRSRIDRDNEFMKHYREVLDLMMEQGVPDARKAAIDFTVLNSRPHYHVSFDRAYVVVSKILNSSYHPAKPTLQTLMWNEIADKVSQLIATKRLSIARALQFVLEHCRASRFFISPQYAYFHLHPHKTFIKQNIL
mgnify:CR=1 FL=1